MKVPERGARVLLIIASLVLVIAGLKAVKLIALPILLALFLSILSVPLLKWLCRHRIPKVIAVMTTVLANVSVMAVFLLLVGGSINAFARSIPQYQERYEAKAESMFEWLESRDVDTSTFNWLRQYLLRSEDTAGELLPEGESEAPLAGDPVQPDTFRSVEESPEGLLSLDSIFDLIVNLSAKIARSLVSILIVFVLMIFMLFEASGLPRKLQAAFGWRNETMVHFATEIQRYLLIKTLISLATGLLVGLGLWLIGVDYPLLWGLLAFAFNYVPNVGSIIASIFPVLLNLVDKGLGQAILVALIFLAANVTFGNFVEPHLMGRQFGISTLVVVLSLIFWGWLWGPLGMLLSVPLTMIVKIMMENTADFRWVARLIGANPRRQLEPGSLGAEEPKPTLAGTSKG